MPGELLATQFQPLPGSPFPNHWLFLLPLAFLICSIAFFPYVRLLKKLKVQQYLREEGPKSHAFKSGTPTAGGICFITCFVLVLTGSWVAMPDTASLPALAVSLAAVLCGVLGLWDDYGKLASRSNRGLSAKMRLVVEGLLGVLLGLVLIYLGLQSPSLGALWAVFTGHSSALSSPVALLLVGVSVFLLTACTNSVNLHDGMDGLAAGTSMMVFATIAIMLLSTGQPYLATVAATVVAVLLAFLFYNKYPAQIFMGDTGSLFLGGLMGALVFAGGLVVYFVPLSLIYITESLSVMAQFSWFRLTKDYTPAHPMSKPELIFRKLTTQRPGEGKRIFRMTPIHHHFEIVGGERGIKEWQVVMIFWGVQLVLSALVLALFFATDKVAVLSMPWQGH